MHSLLLIWGAGGHGKVVLDVARSTALFERVIFVDDGAAATGAVFCNCPVAGGPEELAHFPGAPIVIAVGDNRKRARCLARARQAGLTPTTLIHASAVVAASARIGAGTVIMAGSIINADAAIGENCIINTAAVIEHDCRIGDHVHLSPRVALGGGVAVGTLTHIGIGAVVLPGAVVGEESIVGAGAVVLREVAAGSTVAGVPAKVLSCQPLH